MNNAGQWLVTTGSTTSAQTRPAQILPETNRQYLNRQENRCSRCFYKYI